MAIVLFTDSKDWTRLRNSNSMIPRCNKCKDDGFITSQEGVTVCECCMQGGINYEGGGYEEDSDSDSDRDRGLGGALVLANR